MAGPRSVRVRFASPLERGEADLTLPGLRSLGRVGVGERVLLELSWQAWHRASFAQPGSEYRMSPKTELPSWQMSTREVTKAG